MKANTKRLNVFAKLAIFVFVVFWIITFISQMNQISILKSDDRQKQEKVEQESEIVEELENKLDAPFDDEYIIGVAKEKLDYCFPEEVYFIVN